MANIFLVQFRRSENLHTQLFAITLKYAKYFKIAFRHENSLFGSKVLEKLSLNTHTHTHKH